MAVLDGNSVAEKYREDLKSEVKELREKGIKPTIAPILVGEDPGAKIYFRQKKKLAEEIDVGFSGLRLPAGTDEKKLIDSINELNDNPEIHGLFVELPLPGDLKLGNISSEIDPRKDVDCINPASAGELVAGGVARKNYRQLKNDPKVLLPATPYGVMELLSSYEIDLEGREVTLVGGGANGLPLALLVLREGYSTVTICEYKEEKLAEKTRRADVLISAMGKKDFISADMIKDGAIVVDVGVNEADSGITGDVDFEEVKEKASYITPVPGGVGPMTTTMIMSNTVKAARNLNEKE